MLTDLCCAPFGVLNGIRSRGAVLKSLEKKAVLKRSVIIVVRCS
jgi:hypothetical protein